MHEMSLAESMLRIIEEQAVVQDFSRVKKVFLEIGKLSTVEPEAMAFCFDAVSRDTVLEGAELIIIRTPGTAWCLGCSQAVEIDSRTDACPECGSFQLQVTGGEEMRLKELEVG